MKLFSSRGDEPLERALRTERPAPSPELLARVSTRLQEESPRRRVGRRRVAVAAVLTASMVVALAGVGGIGYAASGAKHVVQAAQEITGPSASTSEARKSPARNQYTTTICHRTGSPRNPWVEITVSDNALPAHSAHGDIIPAPAGGCPR